MLWIVDYVIVFGLRGILPGIPTSGGPDLRTPPENIFSGGAIRRTARARRVCSLAGRAERTILERSCAPVPLKTGFPGMHRWYFSTVLAAEKSWKKVHDTAHPVRPQRFVARRTRRARDPGAILRAHLARRTTSRADRPPEKSIFWSPPPSQKTYFLGGAIRRPARARRGFSLAERAARAHLERSRAPVPLKTGFPGMHRWYFFNRAYG